MPTPSAFLRTLKEELVRLREWTSPAALFAALRRWIADYNTSYLHSTLAPVWIGVEC
jgi:transposase InsO family protein